MGLRVRWRSTHMGCSWRVREICDKLSNIWKQPNDWIRPMSNIIWGWQERTPRPAGMKTRGANAGPRSPSRRRAILVVRVSHQLPDGRGSVSHGMAEPDLGVRRGRGRPPHVLAVCLILPLAVFAAPPAGKTGCATCHQEEARLLPQRSEERRVGK